MSITYTPQTNFTAKDNMGTSNPDKVLSGVPFDVEFTAISNAFQQAAGTANPSFTGTTTTDVLVATTVNGVATSVWDATTATVNAKEAIWDAGGAFTSKEAGYDATKATVDASASNWNTAFGWGDHSSQGYLVATPADKTAYDNTVLTVSSKETSWDAGYNDKVNSASFNTTTGVLTLAQQDGGSVTVDLDGRYSTTDTNSTYTNGAGLDLNAGQFSHTDTSSQSSVTNSGNAFIKSITLDTFGHIQSITSGDPATTAYTAGGGLGLSGTTFSHADTSAVSNTNNTGTTVLANLTFDTYGHVTGATATTLSNTDTTYTAGSGLGLSGTTFSHADTSSASSVNNSGNTFIQDINFDAFGHVTSVAMGTAAFSAGAGLDISGTTFSIEPDLRDGITHVGLDNTDFIAFSNNTKVGVTVNSTERLAVNTSGVAVTGVLTATSTFTGTSGNFTGNITAGSLSTGGNMQSATASVSGASTVGSTKIGNFTIQLDGASNLRISHSTGGDLFNIDSSGNLVVKGNVTAYGAP